ncbi:MAG: helix-turn-helix transcriptional regulator [Pseudomonadota bacterium]|uniref:helix-turn-helix domain-containing protein n=1 Tax=Phenylobacterium sp. TaxID=1871053 RepID=UPI0025E0B905|nr:helix-turn-helix transcriptional regulator [Phenylobacterium sp.]MBT9470524.1 helix-turn-helix transcriptional regulator [Phenylobacterium sp.]
MTYNEVGLRTGNRLFTDQYAVLVDLLRTARERSGLSQRGLGERIGRSPSHICMIERRQRRVEVVEFILIAQALECDPLELIRTLMGDNQAGPGSAPDRAKPDRGHHAI